MVIASRAVPLVLVLLLPACSDHSHGQLAPVTPDPIDPSLRFVDATSVAGLGYGYDPEKLTMNLHMGGGSVAAGDYDRDGYCDLYVVRSSAERNLLFKNRGDGTFAEVAVAAGVAAKGEHGCGPAFADIDGDGWLDLFVGGIDGDKPRLFWNRQDGTFADITADSGLDFDGNTFSAAFGDYDRDGDLDLFVSHYRDVPKAKGKDRSTQHVWRNNGDRTFTDVSVECGVAATIVAKNVNMWDFTFTPNLADIDSDGWPDLLFAGDFGSSKVYLNQRNRTFKDITDAVISDENGMGAAVGDYDNDGDLDWFVSSIWDPDGIPQGDWGITGNRLYRNGGLGIFEDVTAAAGVRKGYWGWGASFADFDNNGWLDIVHVNGFSIMAQLAREFVDDPTRLFLSKGDGMFVERATATGLVDTGQGRGVVCFDYDRDGDLDIFIANAGEPGRLFRNDLQPGAWLTVKLAGKPPNTAAIGARVYVTAAGKTQMRELRCGCNYVSQEPAEAHFGLGSATVVETLRLVWPDGIETTRRNVATNQLLELRQPR
ncbi:MAG: CRTAC1 family protein [Planctomycetota bacterium]|jgi:hypothetical protein